MESEGKPEGSVFDILYADNRRISSILSQLSEDGIVTELSRINEASDTKNVEVNVKVVKVSGADTGKQTLNQKIDPRWLLPLLMLDEAQDMINVDLSEASIGSLALVSGRLFMTDLNLLKAMWDSSAMRKFMLKSMVPAEQPANRQQARANRNAKVDTSEQEALLEFMARMPHSIQANILTANDAIWSTLDPEWLVGPASDILLKHGSKVAGHWSMVGIVDVAPFEDRGLDADYDEFISPNEQARLGMFGDNVWKVATELGANVREALGRPVHAFGMTPLVIFREIERR
ncbi:hypothetical protein [uncultured Sphingomonas sp.]|uniref:DUF6414 family protein n=1 Tax=uncultured Sphingomonas sp. TaxID=158754 RepID=UPI0025E5157B|nr:hypothetical protein [uncultured Sphingomonas sp.]